MKKKIQHFTQTQLEIYDLSCNFTLINFQTFHF